MARSAIPKRVVEQHRLAMSKADEGDVAARAGSHELARTHYRAALELERNAGLAISVEPSRAIVLRSAASLALLAGDQRECERLACIALGGSPPHEIAEELRDLLEEAGFHRHLDLRGLVLLDEDMRMAIAGDAIGPGMAPARSLTKRVEDLGKLLIRTAERTLNRKFKSDAKRAAKEEYELYVSTPRAASMAVSLRLARPKQELMFPNTHPPAVIVKETFDCLAMLQNQQDDLLRARIADDSYYENFVGLARAVAPDGKDIRTVAFSQRGADGPRELSFRRAAHTIRPVSSAAPSSRAEETFAGVLNFADARQRRGVVEVGGHRITVPPGMIDDVVRPLWGQQVKVTVTRRDTKRFLVAIDRLEAHSVS